MPVLVTCSPNNNCIGLPYTFAQVFKIVLKLSHYLDLVDKDMHITEICEYVNIVSYNYAH